MQEYKHDREGVNQLVRVEEVKSAQNSKREDIGYPEKILNWNCKY